MPYEPAHRLPITPPPPQPLGAMSDALFGIAFGLILGVIAGAICHLCAVLS